MDEISKMISSGIDALKRQIQLKRFMIPSPSHSLIIAVQSGMVNINQLNEKLQKLQNRAARVITKSSYEVNSLLKDALGWEIG